MEETATLLLEPGRAQPVDQRVDGAVNEVGADADVVPVQTLIRLIMDHFTLNIDTFQSGFPIPFFTFRSKLIESVRMTAGVVRL